MERRLTKEDIKKIAKEYGTTKGAEEISKEIGVSKQRVQQVATILRKNGVHVPSIRNSESQIPIAIEELRKENPELFKETK
mgnify:CR=1 FL=1